MDQLINREIDEGNPNVPGHTHQETFGYDAAGNLTTQTDYRGAGTALTLDGDDRVTQRVDSFTGQPTITTTMTYDPDGNQLSSTESVSGQQHSFTTSYNTVDNPTSTSDDSFTTSYAGDGEGRLLSQTILNGAGTNQRDQDNLGRVFGIEDGTHTTGISYNADNRPVSVSYPGGASQSAQYDGASRLTQITANGTGVATTYGYGYDPAGWTNSYTTNVTGTNLTQTLAHDALSRLTGASGGTSNGTWSYDGNDNLKQATRNGVTSTYTYSASVADELASVATTGQSTISYGYDGNGDTTSIVGGSVNRQLTYDAQGRLTQITLGSPITETITMGYNAEGQRATYSVTPQGAGQPSLSEHFQYRGGQDLLPAQVAYTGTSVTTPYTDTYLYRQDGTPAELIRQQGSTTSDHWYVLDGRGNVVAVADSTGHFVDKYQYDLWGAPVSVSEQVPQQLRYGSYWYDGELGWYWLSVREYDPALERFLQPDPSELEGLFSYAYAQNDPIDYADPSGFVSCTSTTPAVLVANSGNTVDADDGDCTTPQSQEDLSGSSPEARLATKGLAGAQTNAKQQPPATCLLVVPTLAEVAKDTGGLWHYFAVGGHITNHCRGTAVSIHYRVVYHATCDVQLFGFIPVEVKGSRTQSGQAITQSIPPQKGIQNTTFKIYDFVTDAEGEVVGLQCLQRIYSGDKLVGLQLIPFHINATVQITAADASDPYTLAYRSREVYTSTLYINDRRYINLL